MTMLTGGIFSSGEVYMMHITIFLPVICQRTIFVTDDAWNERVGSLTGVRRKNACQIVYTYKSVSGSKVQG